MFSAGHDGRDLMNDRRGVPFSHKYDAMHVKACVMLKTTVCTITKDMNQDPWLKI